MPFPKYLLVREEQDGDDTYLVAASTVQDHIESGEPDIKLARYKLIGTGVVRTHSEYVEDEQG
jgi:hypothetical protein